MSSEISRRDFLQQYYMRDKTWKPLTKPRIETNDFVQTIRDGVLFNNETHDILCLGLKGSSKSSSCMGLAKLIDPNFSIKNVAFNIDEQVELSKTLPKGSVILFDDAGMMDGGSSRRSMSTVNQVMMDIAQMCRTDKHITIYTTIEDSRLDKRVRTQFPYIVSPVQKISYDWGLASVLEVFKNTQFINREQSGETFVQIQRSRLKYGSGNLTHVVVPHCPKDLMIEYNELREKRLETARSRAITTQKYKKEIAEED